MTLRELRQRLGLQQVQVARLSGYSRNMMVAVESGRRREPKGLRARLADGLERAAAEVRNHPMEDDR